MGVERSNYSIMYLDRSTPSLALPLQGEGTFTHLHEPSFMQSPWPNRQSICGEGGFAL